MASSDEKTECQPRRFISRSQSIERQNVKRPYNEGDMNIAVLGHSDVGKSALIVRYITGRFIGDYSHHESVCTYSAIIDGKPVKLNMKDSCGKDGVGYREDLVRWADGVLLVFSMTDRPSFDHVSVLIRHIGASRLTAWMPLVMLANKSDLAHRREVSTAEAVAVANALRCPYLEVSASDSYDGVVRAFTALYHEKRAFLKRDKIYRLASRGALARISQIRDTLRRSLNDTRGRTYTF